ncbi:hypothetical protein [Priestia megaterium]|nr:hypothetical protein [Priestia megaterium]
MGLKVASALQPQGFEGDLKTARKVRYEAEKRHEKYDDISRYENT